MIPKNRHCDGYKRAVEHRGEDKSFRVQTAAGDIKHADSADKQSDKPKVIRSLVAEGRNAKNRNGEMRCEQHDGSFDQNEPAKNFYGLG